MNETINVQTALNFCHRCGTEHSNVRMCRNCKTVTMNLSQNVCTACGQPMPVAKYCTSCKKIANDSFYRTPNGSGSHKRAEEITLFSAFGNMYKNYANFYGRTRRKEYWLAGLGYLLVFCLIAIISLIFWIWFKSCYMPGATRFSLVLGILLVSIFTLASIVPSYALLARRLHDIGQSGWVILVYLIPWIGSMILFVCCCIDSQPGTNKYGPNPKGR